MKSKYAGIVLVLFLVVSIHAQEVSNPADIRSIKEAIAGWDKAWNAGNCELLASLYVNGKSNVLPVEDDREPDRPGKNYRKGKTPQCRSIRL